MDNVKRSILLNGLAGAGSKVLLILIRIIQVPLLLSVLGTEEYGHWIILTSIPNLISLTNLGFGSVATNEMSMAIGEKDFLKAKIMFSTCLSFTTLIGLIGIIVSFPVVNLVEWNNILKVSEGRQQELIQTIFFLLTSLFISFSGEVYGGRMIATRKTHLYLIVYSLKPWIDLFALYGISRLTIKFNFLAGSQLFSTVIYLFLLRWISLISVSTIKFSYKNIHISYFKSFLKKGVAFQAMPLGNAILYQGSLFIVQTNLGATAVAIYSTIRTLIRSVSQMLDLINSSTWAEISLLVGAGNWAKLIRLHRLSVGCAILLSSLGVIFLAIFGNSIYRIWVGKFLPIPASLLLLFLLPIPFYSIWYTSSVVHMASNKHERLAANYLGACCLSAAGCYVLTMTNGLNGAAVSTVIADILLIPFVIKRSLYIMGDNWMNFVQGIIYELKEAYSYFENMFRKFKNNSIILANKLRKY